MTLATMTAHFSFQEIKGGNYGGRPVTIIIIEHCPAAALTHRQTRLDLILGNDLGIFIHFRDQAFSGGFRKSRLKVACWQLLTRRANLLATSRTHNSKTDYEVLSGDFESIRNRLRPLARFGPGMSSAAR